MSIGFDPLVSSVLFSAALVPHAARPKARLELPTHTPVDVPFVTVVVALYREKWTDIEMTIDSLVRQTYARNRFEVLLAIEARDPDIQPAADWGLRKLRAAGIDAAIVTSDGGPRLKAYALNRCIERARGDICAFYDASDDIAPTQLADAALLMAEKGYDACQATVLRKGRSILSEFLLIDTAFWFRKYIPFVLGLAHGMPLSGEGLFVRTSVLRELGGFPEVLTEDAYLGLLLTERGKRFGLVSSVITEKAPKNLRAHFVQRLRWNRGYLTCLWRLVRSNLSIGRKCVLSLPFLTPFTCALAFLGWLAILAHWGISWIEGGVAPGVALSAARPSLYAHVMYYWAAALFFCGIPLSLASYIHTLWTLDMKRSLRLVGLLPIYWSFIGVAATCSFFKSPTNWGKTER
jgi:cellulose synthase/poly-beta-1,6-N-acetylglucosamine synthase-like glycosyltransferase